MEPSRPLRSHQPRRNDHDHCDAELFHYPLESRPDVPPARSIDGAVVAEADPVFAAINAYAALDTLWRTTSDKNENDPILADIGEASRRATLVMLASKPATMLGCAAYAAELSKASLEMMGMIGTQSAPDIAFRNIAECLYRLAGVEAPVSA